MQHSFFQKLILIIIAGAITAGLIEFYKVFIVDSMEPTRKAPHKEATAERRY